MIMQFAIIRLKISLRMRSLYEMRPCIVIHNVMYVIESVCGKGQGGKTVSKDSNHFDRVVSTSIQRRITIKCQ